MEVRSLVHVSNHRIFKLTMILYLALWCFPNEKNTKLTKCYEKGQIAVFVSNLVKTHKKTQYKLDRDIVNWIYTRAGQKWFVRIIEWPRDFSRVLFLLQN